MGLFDQMFSEDPKQAAYMALASGLLGGKGSFNSILGKSMMGAQESYQETRRAQQAAEMNQAQLDEIRRKAARQAREEQLAQEQPARTQQAIDLFPKAGITQGPPDESGAYPTRKPTEEDYLSWGMQSYGLDPRLSQFGFKAAEGIASREDQQRARAEAQSASLAAMMERAREAQTAALERQREGKAADMQRARELQAFAAANRQPRAEQPLVAVIGPDGKPVLVSRSDAVGKTPAPSGGAADEKNLTEDQGKAISWLERMNQAESVIKNAPAHALQSTGSVGGVLGAAIGSVPYLGNTGAAKLSRNLMESPERQAVRNAQEIWVQGLLRSDTGAAYKDMEKDDIIRAFFWQPGEADDVKAQKDLAREGVKRAMTVRAGRGVGRLENVPKEDQKPKASVSNW